MRTAVLLLLGFGTSGCLTSNDDVSDPPPPTISLGPNLHMASGTRHAVGIDALPELDFATSDPSIATVRATSSGFEVETFAPGQTSIIARHRGTSELAGSLPVRSAVADSIDFRYRAAPGADEPITELAGVRGGTDHLCVAYRDAAGNLLVGTGGFRYEGAVRSVAVNSLRASEINVERSACIGMQFTELGAGRIVAELGSVQIGELAIEVIEEPATVGLLAMQIPLIGEGLSPAPEAVRVSDLIGVELVGETADGRHVAGLAATWSSTDNVALVAQHPTEYVFLVTEAEDTIVTATGDGFIAELGFAAE
jgi:hypothetical protein